MNTLTAQEASALSRPMAGASDYARVCEAIRHMHGTWQTQPRLDDIAAHGAHDVGQWLRDRAIGGKRHQIGIVVVASCDLQDARLARAEAHLVPPLRRR